MSSTVTVTESSQALSDQLADCISKAKEKYEKTKEQSRQADNPPPTGGQTQATVINKPTIQQNKIKGDVSNNIRVGKGAHVSNTPQIEGNQGGGHISNNVTAGSAHVENNPTIVGNEVDGRVSNDIQFDYTASREPMMGRQAPKAHTFAISASRGATVNHPILLGCRVGGAVKCAVKTNKQQTTGSKDRGQASLQTTTSTQGTTYTMDGQGYNSSVSATDGEFVNHAVMSENQVGGAMHCTTTITGQGEGQKVRHEPQIFNNQVGGAINADINEEKLTKKRKKK